MNDPYKPGFPNTHTEVTHNSGLGSFGNVIVSASAWPPVRSCSNCYPLKAIVNPKACLVQGQEVPQVSMLPNLAVEQDALILQ